MTTVWYFIGKCTRPFVALRLQGIGDLGVSAMLMVAVVLQLAYIPTRLGQCDNYSGPKAVTDMFAGLGADKDSKSPEFICYDFVTTWCLAVTMLFVHCPLDQRGIQANLVLQRPDHMRGHGRHPQHQARGRRSARVARPHAVGRALLP